MIITTAYREFAADGEKLPADKFMRIHKSYIVAFDRISSYNAESVTVGAFSLQWVGIISKTLSGNLTGNLSGHAFYMHTIFYF